MAYTEPFCPKCGEGCTMIQEGKKCDEWECNKCYHTFEIEKEVEL